MSVTPARRLLPLSACLAFLAAVAIPVAAAPSRHDQAAVEAIQQRMADAEARYRQAVIDAGNLDPDARNRSDAALEDMEDAIIACGQQRDCAVSGLLSTYERLLKDAADGELADGGDAGVDAHALDPAGAIAADVPEAVRAASLLDAHTHRFDDMVQFNPAVQAGIRRWLTDMRGQLLDSYQNYQYLRQLMWPTFERAGLPEALLFGIMAKESNGKVHATSRAGAAGPMQFMYATGQRFGLGVDSSGFDTRYDPHAAAQASAAYLNERLAELNDSIELSLAAYNGGEGRALRVFQGSGGLGFWNAEVYSQFPAETQDYVPMVIAAAWLFLHPDQYGVSFPRVDARPALLKLQRSASLYELAICLGNRGQRDGYLRPLRNLNPRIQPDSWLPQGGVLHATTRIVGLYNRYCVSGPRASLAQQLVHSDPEAAIVRAGDGDQAPDLADSGPPSAGVKPQTHVVKRGETLTSIARRYQCSTGELARDNRIKPPRYAIRPGQEIELAGCVQ